jgi:type I restriction enzyme S subunit
MIKATNLIQTGIAWIPEIPKDWELKRIKLLFDFNKNIVGKTSADYDVLSLTTKGVIKRDLESGMGKFPASFDGYQIVKPNSIMLCLFDMDVTPRVVGHVDDEGIISAAYTNIIPKKGINSKYYYYYFLLQDKNKSLLALGTGIRITLNKDFFGTLKIPFPPLSVQNSIVAYLDKKNEQIDTFIRNKERLIELLEGQKKRIIYDYVTKGIRKDRELTEFEVGIFGRIPSDWIVSKLKYVCYNLNNRRIPLESVERGRMTNRIYDYYGATGVIDQVEDYIFDETTILIAEDGANLVSRNLQLVYIATGKYWVNNHSHIIKPRNNMNLHYLSYLLDLTDYNPFITGSTQPKLTKEAFMSTVVIRPTIQEQNEIIKSINEEIEPINLAISKAQKEIASIKEYREALITDLVTGKRSVSQ